MQKISAVINTRNEEQNIRFCLEALKWCDEIIVVDMESEDKTVEIVREYTDKIFNHEKVLAFDIARKFAVEQASCEWILLIDADELMPESLSNKLIEISKTDETDAVFMPFKNYLLGEWNKYTGWWPDYHCRFFKKTMMEFSKDIHGYQHLNTDAKTLYLPIDEKYAIHHFAYRDTEQFIEKLNRYTSIEAVKYYEDNIHFKSYKMFTSSINEFYCRYVKMKGYKDGPRGLFVSILMGIYRMVSYFKLWELYENNNQTVLEKYNKIKREMINTNDV
jgi:glycosyltransferase involved in cell wall biosynthesis